MARRRRQREEESGGYSWMDTYGDLVTLLLCFFVLLYSFSSIDSQKWQELVGAFSGRSAVSVEQLDTKQVKEEAITIEGVEKREKDINKPSVMKEYEEEFDALYEAIRYYVHINDLDEKISVIKEDGVIVIRFLEVILFNSGEAAILEEGQTVLGHIMSIIEENADVIRILRIEGHTDNVPIHTAQFRSNWELSMARANAALRVFVDSGVISLDKLSAAAYGEYHPVETNETPEGRAANRRVDFVVERIDTESQ
jgi:chemotaxis protein MotB